MSLLHRGGEDTRGELRSTPGARPEAGFTLVEVMVAAAITLVAFTGLATVQVMAMRAADSAMQRSQATALAYEMIDRLRLNRGDRAHPAPFTAFGGGYDNETLCHGGARHPEDTRTCLRTGLASLPDDDNASVDLRAWWQALDGASLNHWFAGIRRDGNRFLVTVQWDDSRAEEEAPGPQATRESCWGDEAMPEAMQEICVMTQL